MKQALPHNRLLTITDAGRRIGLSRGVTLALVARGELKAVRVGSRQRVPINAVQDYLRRIGLEQAV